MVDRWRGCRRHGGEARVGEGDECDNFLELLH